MVPDTRHLVYELLRLHFLKGAMCVLESTFLHFFWYQYRVDRRVSEKIMEKFLIRKETHYLFNSLVKPNVVGYAMVSFELLFNELSTDLKQYHQKICDCLYQDYLRLVCYTVTHPSSKRMDQFQ